MEADRTGSAMARIDAALARIEAAARRSASTNETDLATRHQALRDAVAQSLRELDTLIGAQG